MKLAQTLLVARVGINGVQILDTIRNWSNEQAQILQVIDMVSNYTSNYESLVIVHAGRRAVLKVFHGYSTSVEMRAANEIRIMDFMDGAVRNDTADGQREYSFPESPQQKTSPKCVPKECWIHIKVGDMIEVGGQAAKVNEVFSQGFKYHKRDAEGNVIGSEEYALKRQV